MVGRGEDSGVSYFLMCGWGSFISRSSEKWNVLTGDLTNREEGRVRDYLR